MYHQLRKEMNVMNKRFLSYIISLVVIFSCWAPVYAADEAALSKPETVISPSMDFIGVPITLTLAEAVKRITTEGPGYESAVLKKETFEKQALEQEETWNQFRQISNAILAESAKGGSTMQTNPMKSLNAKIVKMTRPYLLTQAAIQYQMDINNLAYETTQSYYRGIQAAEAERIAVENLKNVKNTLTNTNKKFELGVVSKLEVLQAESAVLEAEAQLGTAEVNYKTLRMAFNQKLGYPLMQNVVLTDKLTRTTQSSIYLKGCIESALEKRNELAQLQYVLDTAQLRLDDKVMVSRYRAEYLTALLDLREAEKRLNDTKTMIELDIRSRYLNIMNIQKEITSLEKKVSNALESYRLSELSYNAGMNTLTDVQSAQLGSYQAQLGLSNKILELNLAMNELSLVIGYGKPVADGGGQ